MSFVRKKALIAVLALLSAYGASGCSSDGAPTGDPAGSGGAAGDTCDKIDYASYADGPVPSFKNDVMPIFGLSCTASTCHNSHDHNAGLDLGWKCNPIAATATTPFRCEFPAALDPTDMSLNPAKPLTPDVLAAVYKSLMDPAKTVIPPSPPTPRVIPGNAEHSFLIEKVAVTQAKQGYTCKNQDPSHTQNPQPCGDSMPLGNEPLCSGSNRPRFDTLARWIAHGAPGDN